jgi:thiamine-phosphate pyrophosphorylase
VIRCYITDRHTLREGTLIETIAANLEAGVDWIQIREKDLSARALFDLIRSALALPNPHRSKILVNSRVDVALSVGAAGVHLPAGSPPPDTWRPIVPAGFLIGVSCHTLEEVRAAEAGGADYALFGPVFQPLSKYSDLSAVGIGALTRAAGAVRIPVLAREPLGPCGSPCWRWGGSLIGIVARVWTPALRVSRESQSFRIFPETC